MKLDVNSIEHDEEYLVPVYKIVEALKNIELTKKESDRICNAFNENSFSWRKTAETMAKIRTCR